MLGQVSFHPALSKNKKKLNSVHCTQNTANCNIQTVHSKLPTNTQKTGNCAQKNCTLQTAYCKLNTANCILKCVHWHCQCVKRNSLWPPLWQLYCVHLTLWQYQAAAVLSSGLQCGHVQSSAVLCSALQCTALQCSEIWCCAVLWRLLQCITVQYSAVQFSAVCLYGGIKLMLWSNLGVVQCGSWQFCPREHATGFMLQFITLNYIALQRLQ